MTRHGNKEVREEVKRLQRAGWHMEGFDSRRGHLHLTFRDQHLWLPATPSDVKWKQPARQTAAARMGISRPELEVRMGVRERKAKGKHRRTRRRSRQTELTRKLNPPPEAKPQNTEFVTPEQLGL